MIPRLRFPLAFPAILVLSLATASRASAQKGVSDPGAIPAGPPTHGNAGVAFVATHLRGTAQSELNRRHLALDPAAEAQLRQLVDQAAARVARDGTQDQMGAIDQGLSQLVGNLSAARGGRGGVVGQQELRGALTKFCPFYPFC
jgi:hypothetical protein